MSKLTQASPTGSPTAEEAVASADKAEMARYRILPWAANAWLQIAALAAILSSIYVIFGIGNQLKIYVPLETEYFYFMIAALLPLPFLIYPTQSTPDGRVGLLELIPAALALAVPAYFAVQLLKLEALQSLGSFGNLVTFAVLFGIFALPYYWRRSDQNHIPLFDLLLAVLAFATAGYFAFKGNAILEIGWEYDAPLHAK